MAHTLTDRLPEFEMHRMSLEDGAVLERGCVYVVPLMERLALPADVSAVANAKSSTGRVDCLTRVITDDGTEFDRIAPGYEGPLFAEICPRSFSVLVKPGLRLNQIRFRSGEAILTDAGPHRLSTVTSPLVAGTEGALIDDGLGFSVDLTPGPTGIVGYRAKPHAGVIDLTRIAAHDIADFWEELRPEGTGTRQHIILDPGAFYILVSREAVSIPPDCAAEMAPYVAMVGEFRVHYAGFFDPGFGHGVPARGVLEVRCHEAPFVLEHGPGRGATGLRTHGVAPRPALRRGPVLELPGPGPEAVEALPHRLTARFPGTPPSPAKTAPILLPFAPVVLPSLSRRRPTDLSDRRRQHVDQDPLGRPRSHGSTRPRHGRMQLGHGPSHDDELLRRHDLGRIHASLRARGQQLNVANA
jgi:dCTP deaminase